MTKQPPPRIPAPVYSQDTWTTLAEPPAADEPAQNQLLQHRRRRSHNKHDLASIRPAENDGSPKSRLRSRDATPIRWSTCTLAADLPDDTFPFSPLRPEEPAQRASSLASPHAEGSDDADDYRADLEDDDDYDDDGQRTHSSASTRPTSLEAEKQPHRRLLDLHTPARLSSLAGNRPRSAASPVSCTTTLAEPELAANAGIAATSPPVHRSNDDGCDSDDSDEEDEADPRLDALIAQTMRALEVSNNLLLSTLNSRAKFAQLRAIEASIDIGLDRRERSVRRQLHAVEQMTDFVGAKSDELRDLLASGSATRPYTLARAQTAGANQAGLASLPSLETLASTSSGKAKADVGVGIVEAQDRDATIGKTAAKRLEKMLLDSARSSPTSSRGAGDGESGGVSGSSSGTASSSIGRLRAVSADGHLSVGEGHSASNNASPSSRRTFSLSDFAFLDVSSAPKASTSHDKTSAAPTDLSAPVDGAAPSSRPPSAMRKRSSRGSSLASIVEHASRQDARPSSQLGSRSRDSPSSSRRNSFASSSQPGDANDSSGALVEAEEEPIGTSLTTTSRLTSSSSTGTIRASARAAAATPTQKRAVSNYETSASRSLFRGSAAASSLSRLVTAPVAPAATASVQKGTLADDFGFSAEPPSSSSAASRARRSRTTTAGLPSGSGDFESGSTYAALVASSSAHDPSASLSGHDDCDDADISEASTTSPRPGTSMPRRYSITKRSSFGGASSSDRERQSVAAQLKAEDVVWRAAETGGSAAGGGSVGALRALQRLNEMSSSSAAGAAADASSSSIAATSGTGATTESKRLSIGLGLPSFAAFKGIAPTASVPSEGDATTGATTEPSSTDLQAPTESPSTGWRTWTPWASPVVPATATTAAGQQASADRSAGKSHGSSGGGASTSRKPSLASLLAVKATPTTATVIGT
ncbi:uncharacterized protein PFL1_01778 [Pseudozyma flocculosa PF-1]|uniref:Uncharacterized protein n=1 Tax=Pseudozyma flocculosa TaxID=84751 RepID=A0A5C3F0F5_9BASI|nr:uncharacterized protein PFL1_01778 [Pseudozyma flocculosa PF-1]EPQ30881.1 hypothetical protein PFL1_01778 [Pseudozyma flocculosa PF-1]SPO36741.1 uncharacterized protein PSFLO_02212 [Pseudozyma flocculosa]